MILGFLIYDTQFSVNLSAVANGCGTFSELLEKLSDLYREHIITYFFPSEQCASGIWC